ncbi:hypothetical protein ACJX0J_010344 [Zea mays]
MSPSIKENIALLIIDPINKLLDIQHLTSHYIHTNIKKDKHINSCTPSINNAIHIQQPLTNLYLLILSYPMTSKTFLILKEIHCNEALEGSALLGSYYAAENVEDPSLDENLGANLSASSFPSGPGAFWEGIARITLFISSSEKGVSNEILTPPPPYLYGSKRYQR